MSNIREIIDPSKIDIVVANHSEVNHSGSLHAIMRNGTCRMAEAIGDGFADAGVDHRIYHVAVTDRNDIITDIFRSKTIVIGSPTVNSVVLPTITFILEDIRGLKFQNKIGFAFECYGWSGEPVRLIEEHLVRCNIPLIREGIKFKWRPSLDNLSVCRSFGKELGKATKNA